MGYAGQMGAQVSGGLWGNGASAAVGVNGSHGRGVMKGFVKGHHSHVCGVWWRADRFSYPLGLLRLAEKDLEGPDMLLPTCCQCILTPLGDRPAPQHTQCTHTPHKRSETDAQKRNVRAVSVCAVCGPRRARSVSVSPVVCRCSVTDRKMPAEAASLRLAIRSPRQKWSHPQPPGAVRGISSFHSLSSSVGRVTPAARMAVRMRVWKERDGERRRGEVRDDERRRGEVRARVVSAG